MPPIQLTLTSGEKHDCYPRANAVVTVFREEKYQKYNHIWHRCAEGVCEVGDNKDYHLFGAPDLIDYFISNGFDELVRWQPTDQEVAAYEEWQKHRPMTQEEAEEFLDQLNEDGVDWDELFGVAMDDLLATKMDGLYGWLCILLFVIWWDTRHETLSDAFWRSLATNWRFFTVPLWLVLTAHLFALVPARYDPVDQFGSLIYRLLLRG